jgi:hypothetical protein
MLTAQQAKELSNKNYNIQLQKAIKKKEELSSEAIRLLPNILKE